GGGDELGGDSACAGFADAVTAQVEGLDVGVHGGLDDGCRAVVAEAVGAEEEVAYRAAAFGEGFGYGAGAEGAQVLLAHVQAAVGEGGAGWEVGAGGDGFAGAEPGEEGGQIGGGVGDDRRGRWILIHQAADR